MLPRVHDRREKLIEISHELVSAGSLVLVQWHGTALGLLQPDPFLENRIEHRVTEQLP